MFDLSYRWLKLRQVESLTGVWLGTIGGTNSASLQISIRQEGQRLIGAAIIYEPIIGKYAYSLVGTLGPPASFHLEITRGHPHQGLGPVNATIERLLPTNATGRWRSANGAHGTFEIEKMAEASVGALQDSAVDSARDKVFIAHGHDEGLREGVARYVQNLIGSSPIILQERTDRGRSLIEKFEQESTAASYAIIIAAPDDVGYSVVDGPEHAKPRARENVWFELGFFAGKIRRERTCVLYRGNVQIPSDLGGIAYIPAENPETWKVRVARELRGAGFKLSVENALL